MAQAKRNVRRQTANQALVRKYNTRAWYDLPDWARSFMAGAMVWIAAFFALILLPGAVYAAVLGFHALPLEFLGIAATENGAGLTLVMLLVKFGLIALAIKPLNRRERKGWVYLVLAAGVHMAHSWVLGHGITGTTEFLLALYLYSQLKQFYRT